ncbi:MAG: hypothetical protein E7675_02460 [Ruminococcaceae bacterium]|nr:hypothetical protein [Oscillospiraceae bacterium]
MSFSNYLGSPELYLESKLRSFSYSNIICMGKYTSDVCYGVRREFRRSGRDIYVTLTVKVDFHMSSSDYGFSSELEDFLEEAFDEEISVYEDALEEYDDEYDDDPKSYNIYKVTIKDTRSGRSFDFYN